MRVQKHIHTAATGLTLNTGDGSQANSAKQQQQQQHQQQHSSNIASVRAVLAPLSQAATNQPMTKMQNQQRTYSGLNEL
jgi:hypothetical protein